MPRRSLLTFALLFAMAGPAKAATCDVTADGVAFGAYDPFEPRDLDGVGNVHISCDATVNVEIALSAGAGSFAARTMTGGPDQMIYNLFTSPQRVTVWGDGSGGSESVSATVQTRDFSVYGRIPGRQNLRPGDYVDTVYVTVTY